MTNAVGIANGAGVRVARDLSETELALITLLQADGRATYSALGRALGIAPKVAGRLAQGLIDRHIIEITAVTVPSVFGYRALASVLMRSQAGSSRHDTARQLFQNEAVDYVAVMSGPYDLMANVVCRDLSDLSLVVEGLMQDTTGASLVEVAPYLSLPLQRPSRTGVLRVDDSTTDASVFTLEEVDRRILDRLLRDGRESYLQIAAALNVSESYVRQRVQRMTDSGAVQIRAIVDPRSLGFEVQAWVTIEHCSGHPETIVEAMADISAASFLAETAGSFAMFAEVLCADVGELRSSINSMREVVGVTRVTPHVYFDLFYKPMRLQ